MLIRQLLIISFCSISVLLSGQIVYDTPSEMLKISRQALILEDENHELSKSEVFQFSESRFEKRDEDIINFKHTNSKFWIRLDIENQTNQELTLLVENPLIHYLNVFVINEDSTSQEFISGSFTPHKTRSLKSSNYTFELGTNPKTVLIETSSSTDYFFPMSIGAVEPVVKNLHKNDIFNGAYLGLMLAMLLYNLFIFFNIKDRVYFYYILHIGVSLIMMLRFRGIGFDLFWSETPALNGGSSIFLCLIVITSILFSTRFLETKKYAPKAHIFLIILAAIAVIISFTIFLDWQPWANIIIQIDAGLLSLSLFFIAGYIYFNGNKAAKYYLIAWTALLVANVVLIMTINGALPITFATITSFQIGSALEAILLSNALADKINTYKAEREQAQQKMLEKAQENERLVKEQNIILEEKVEQRTKELKSEKEKSDDLLLNILPVSVANELKEKGSALPRYFENISVMFIDIAGFTKYSESVSPEKLVKDIHYLFTGFDRICQNNNVEKIKTIGDAYLAASGLPSPNKNHATDIVKTAIECLKFVVGEKEKRPFFDIRIGIHSGPAVAGVVGEKKFAYDIWGDTVNTAARIESAGEPGKICVSKDTHDLLENQETFTYRGKIHAKNKGDLDMYFWKAK